MAFQPVVDTVEIDMIFTLNGVTAQNVFYAELVGGYVLADLVALATQIDVNWQGNWRADQPAEVTYVRTEIRGLALPNDITASNNTSTNPGTHVSAALPNQVTFAIKKESGLTGRSARGRTYWIGIPQNQINPADENLITGSYQTAIVNNVDTVRTSIIAVPLWVPVLLSRFSEGVQRPFGETFPWVSTTSVDNRVDTQRGRLPKV